MRQITEVLRLAAQGLSFRQIGQSVGISASTVQGYYFATPRAHLTETVSGTAILDRLLHSARPSFAA